MKDIIKQVFRSFGFDLVRYTPVPLEQARAINSQQKGADFLKMLTYKEIDLVLDVGANKGQFGSHLFEIGYQGKVISFEPLSSAYGELVEKSNFNPNWTVFDRCAIGDAQGEIEINVAQNSESSSILSMLPSHLDAAPRSAYIDSEKVKIAPLDQVAQQFVKSAKNTLLKIDTQGYESQVIEGSKEILPLIKGLHLEMSLVPLYEGQEVFEDLLIKIKNMGFSLYSLSPAFKDYRTGRLLQVMGTFFRE